MERIRKNRSQTELYETMERLSAVRNSYFRAFELMKNSERVVVIDGNREVGEIADEIEKYVRESIFFTNK